MSKKGSIRLGREANSVEYLAMALEDFAAGGPCLRPLDSPYVRR
jgi:hypothetical protein